MTRAEMIAYLTEKYGAGISRSAAAKELHVSPTSIPVEKLSRFVFPNHKHAKIEIVSLCTWYYSHLELGVFR